MGEIAKIFDKKKRPSISINENNHTIMEALETSGYIKSYSADFTKNVYKFERGELIE